MSKKEFRETWDFELAWSDVIERHADELKKLALKELKKEGIDVSYEDLYTIPELYDYYYDLALSKGVPEEMVSYLDFCEMAWDDYTGGALNYVDVKLKEGGSARVFYWYY